jgi:uncharacterized protein GlcG (DUF336 family)
MKLISQFAVTVTMTMLASAGSAEPVSDKRGLTLDGAKKVIAAAVTEANRINAPGGSIAVVDEGGNLLAMERLEQTFAASANIAIGKARTSALFKSRQKPLKTRSKADVPRWSRWAEICRISHPCKAGFHLNGKEK